MPMPSTPRDERGARARVACREPDVSARVPRTARTPCAPCASCTPRAAVPRPGLRTDAAHPARMYDYYLGGKDNFAIDRDAAEKALAAAPELREIARANRSFLRRAVGFAARSGIRQFLDIGAGLPTAGDTYDYARPGGTDTRVLYVDNDPMVVAHARALLSRPGGATGVVQADLRAPEELLAAPTLRDVLDLDRPVAVLLTAVVHYLSDADDPWGVIATVMDALAPGSLLVVSHTTGDINTESARAAAAAYRHVSTAMTLRSHPQVLELFRGLDLVDPGLVRVPHWRPDRPPRSGADRIWMYAGVAAKP